MNNADCSRIPGLWTQHCLHITPPLYHAWPFFHSSLLFTTVLFIITLLFGYPLSLSRCHPVNPLCFFYASHRQAFFFCLPDQFPLWKHYEIIHSDYFPLPGLTLGSWLIHEEHQGQPSCCCCNSHIHQWIEISCCFAWRKQKCYTWIRLRSLY